MQGQALDKVEEQFLNLGQEQLQSRFSMRQRSMFWTSFMVQVLVLAGSGAFRFDLLCLHHYSWVEQCFILSPYIPFLKKCAITV